MVWLGALKEGWLQYWWEGAEVAGVPWVNTTEILILKTHILKHVGYVKLHTEKEGLHISKLLYFTNIYISKVYAHGFKLFSLILLVKNVLSV